MARRLSAQRPPSARLVAKNLGADLQTPSRVGPRTFCASTQTPPNAPSSEEFPLKSKKCENPIGHLRLAGGRCERPEPSGQPGPCQGSRRNSSQEAPYF